MLNGIIISVGGPYIPPMWHWPHPSDRITTSPPADSGFVWISCAHPVQVNVPVTPHARPIFPAGTGVPFPGLFTLRPSYP